METKTTMSMNELMTVAAIDSSLDIVKLITTAANDGDGDAQWRLGMMYDTGNGVVQDSDIALEWYIKAIATKSLEEIHRQLNEKAAAKSA